MRSGSRIGGILMRRLNLLFCGILAILPVVNVSGQVAQHRLYDSKWLPGMATWYGDPNGDGSTGGACGYGPLVDQVPMKTRVGAVSPVLFMDGEGCGACFKVKCLDTNICSRRAVTIIVTDECPGGPCSEGALHFDLSGAAYSRMAVTGEAGELRNRGLIAVKFRRTACTYRGKSIAFHINEGSTSYWLSVQVEYEDGDGDISSMQIKQGGSGEWLYMNHVWGANWCFNGGPLHGPFSVRITTLATNSTLTAINVIPASWNPTSTYSAVGLNFHV